MKIYKFYLSIVTLLIMFLLQGCEEILNEPVQSQFAANNLLSTKKGLESVLADAYAINNDIIRTRNIVKRNEMTTDILWQTGGGENGTAKPLIEFRWDPSSTLESFDWMPYWQVIRNTNTILDNVNNANDFINETDKSQFVAEVKFIRIWAYYQLWEQYGPVPIRKSLNDPLEIAKASESDFQTFIESELLDLIPDLYEPGSEPAYGRVHKGGAQALLCKWYLNTKQWQKCVGVANDIISSKKFELYPNYYDLFALENEENSEFILVKTKLANQTNKNNLLATTLPWAYKVGLDGGLEGIVNEKWANFASQYRLYDEFYYSFDENDDRRKRILTKYINSSSDTVNLLTDYTNATRALKYPPDPEASGDAHGNDVPMIRFADIILSKAEALNEQNGPNQESIDLINQIRTRAGVDNIALSDFATKESLREHILKERRWEFWYEGHRRRDLIRTGKFIQMAVDRGMSNAKAFHVLFPIPQSAIDANPLLKQNDGY